MPPQLTALHEDRRVTVRGLDARAELAERGCDTIHRPLRQRLVARQLESPLLPREHSREQAHQRAGVPRVDRFDRLREPAKPTTAE